MGLASQDFSGIDAVERAKQKPKILIRTNWEDLLSFILRVNSVLGLMCFTVHTCLRCFETEPVFCGRQRTPRSHELQRHWLEMKLYSLFEREID